jgi:pimeloyl-ACP methyl ester carboxylesterase
MPALVSRRRAVALTSTLSGTLIGALALLVVPPAVAQPLAIEQQGSFFIGGHEVKSDTLSTLSAYAPSGTITVGQMYVHYQIPVGASHTPVTLIHGCCLTGKTWETTPDGRMGWDEYFVRQGFPTYVIDQVARGRSATDPSTFNSVRLGKAAPDQLPPIFSAGHEAAWAIFRFGPEYPKVFDGMQFPLEAQDEFWKQMVSDWNAAFPTLSPTVPALSQLAIKLKGTILISHSQSGIHPFQAAALETQGIAGIVSIEPGGCPAADSDLSPYRQIPILVLFGDYVDQSPRWAPRLRQCREFVEAMKKAGGRTELVVLPETGVKGNSHMLMQDRNSLEIAAWLVGWLNKNVEAKKN